MFFCSQLTLLHLHEQPLPKSLADLFTRGAFLSRDVVWHRRDLKQFQKLLYRLLVEGQWNGTGKGWHETHEDSQWSRLIWAGPKDCQAFFVIRPVYGGSGFVLVTMKIRGKSQKRRAQYGSYVLYKTGLCLMKRGAGLSARWLKSIKGIRQVNRPHPFQLGCVQSQAITVINLLIVMYKFSTWPISCIVV